MIESTIARHERIGLQLSGGRDSIATLYLLKPYWDRLTVYFVDTGDAFPEVVEVVRKVQEVVPNFKAIKADQPDVVARFGLPSDIVPVSHTPFHAMVAGKAPTLIQSRYECCWRVIMAPLARTMMEDGITLVIRGQRGDDALKAPIRSGHVQEGVEYLFPIEDWTAADVMAFIEDQGAPIAPFYDTIDKTPDCMTCSAWWDEGRAQYLKAHHPKHHAIYMARLNTISDAVMPHIANFNVEIRE